MQEVWQRIIVWCEQYAPEIIAGLNSGATEEELRAAETHFGVTFPPQMRELYSLHNGQSEYVPPLLPSGEWLSLTRMRDEWEVLENLRKSGTFDDAPSDPDPGIRGDWWNEKWLPLTENYVCLDLAPAEGGTEGQVIQMWHHGLEHSLLAPSLEEWLREIARRLESGDVVFALEEEYYYARTAERDDLREGRQWRGVDRNAGTALSKRETPRGS